VAISQGKAPPKAGTSGYAFTKKGFAQAQRDGPLLELNFFQTLLDAGTVCGMI
jgi:hypothetical protein